MPPAPHNLEEGSPFTTSEVIGVGGMGGWKGRLKVLIFFFFLTTEDLSYQSKMSGRHGTVQRGHPDSVFPVSLTSDTLAFVPPQGNTAALSMNEGGATVLCQNGTGKAT